MTVADLRRRVVELEEQLQRVTLEATHLLEYARHEQANVAEALEQRDTLAVHLAEHRLARIERMFLRAQLALVHQDDDRYQATQAVKGYCDEADRAGVWHHVPSPLQLGVAKEVA